MTTEPDYIHYRAEPQTARTSPEALAAMLKQSGFPVALRAVADGQVELTSNDVRLTLTVESGFVERIDGTSTFVNDARADRLFELLEVMGWVPEDGD
ncbi:MAG TPA: hypothetical protein VER17_01180 [Tepidisphaeraceae bacterium]|nr:hypothetical protein [Tepidisphaeraceae bacterium]